MYFLQQDVINDEKFVLFTHLLWTHFTLFLLTESRIDRILLQTLPYISKLCLPIKHVSNFTSINYDETRIKD